MGGPTELFILGPTTSSQSEENLRFLDDLDDNREGLSDVIVPGPNAGKKWRE